MNNKAKFFCENCGSEVPENAKVCKTCGKFFISVRCPKCGKTGTHEDFINGCPQCGYAVNGSHSSSFFSNGSESEKKGIMRFFQNGRISNQKSASESSLPLWVYIVTGVVLIVVLFAVYSCIKKPY